LPAIERNDAISVGVAQLGIIPFSKARVGFHPSPVRPQIFKSSCGQIALENLSEGKRLKEQMRQQRTTLSLLGRTPSLPCHNLEARVGIERFLLCLRDNSAQFAEWIKLSLSLLSLSRLICATEEFTEGSMLKWTQFSRRVSGSVAF
jgi:hypothetical protein